jgi:hypothetical protein
MRRGTKVKVGNIEHIDGAEREPRAAGQGAVKETLRQINRGHIVWPQDEAVDGHGIDGRVACGAEYALRTMACGHD